MRAIELLPLLALVMALGCASDPERPKDRSVIGVENPVSCGVAREGSASGGFVVVDGGEANCFPDGLECPVGDQPGFAGACPAGKLTAAACLAAKWQVTCTAVDAGPGSDGGASDAANDG